MNRACLSIPLLSNRGLIIDARVCAVLDIEGAREEWPALFEDGSPFSTRYLDIYDYSDEGRREDDMPTITIKMRDGTVRVFKEVGRAGGSWTNSVRYELGFVIHVDEWKNETAIPTDLVQEVDVTHHDRGSW